MLKQPAESRIATPKERRIAGSSKLDGHQVCAVRWHKAFTGKFHVAQSGSPPVSGDPSSGQLQEFGRTQTVLQLMTVAPLVITVGRLCLLEGGHKLGYLASLGSCGWRQSRTFRRAIHDLHSCLFWPSPQSA